VLDLLWLEGVGGGGAGGGGASGEMDAAEAELLEELCRLLSDVHE